MNRTKSLITVAILAGIPMVAHAQLWLGIIDASRAIDWQAARPGASSISEPRAQCGPTLVPLGGGQDDSAQINKAIADCAPHHYVLLGAGTFSLASGVVFNGRNYVTLRGSGPLATILQWTSSSSGVSCLGPRTNVCVIDPVTYWYGSAAVTPPAGKNQTRWIGGYSQGSTTLTLADTSSLSPGMTLVLDQMNDQVGIAASPNGATQNGSTVTITTLSPHGFSVGDPVYLGNVGKVVTTAATEKGNTVTITTATAHGFTPGQTVCISAVYPAGYNGSFAVANVLSTTQFQYYDPIAGLAAGGYGAADPCYNGGPYAITSVPDPTRFTYTASLTGLAATGGGGATADNGGYRICDVQGACQVIGTESYACRAVNGVHACQTQLVTVTGIAGNNVTVSPGLYAVNWRASQAPGAWWSPATAAGVGIEELTLDNHLDAQNVGSAISFVNTTDSWVSNVRSILSNRNHVYTLQSSHVTVRDSYFYGTLNAATRSYGIEDAITSDLLVENNIFHYVTAPTIGAGGTGSVFAYNYANTDYYKSTSDPALSPVSFSHDAGNVYKLYEGNVFNGLSCDTFHGSSAADTLFRNWLSGWEAGKSGGTNPLMIDAFCRAMNVIGNVLGTPGVQTVYQSDPATKCTSSATIYHLGWPSSACATTLPPADPLVTESLLRWGNYDVVTGAVQWRSFEVPTSGIRYIGGNPVPADHKLPASLYLTSRPGFWATPWTALPWPATGPDVTGGNGPGGFTYGNPAQECFDHTLEDAAFVGVGPGQVIAFDAAACYYHPTQAAAPRR